MLHEKPVRLDPPFGDSYGDRTGPWTRQKRRLYQCPTTTTPSSARAKVRTPSDSPHEPADQDGGSIAGKEEFDRHIAILSTRPPPVTIAGPRMDDERQREVYERISLYRIRASKMAQGVCIDELDDMTLRKEYSPEALEEMYYNDREDTFDWFFDRDYSLYSYLTDYQRLVLKNGDDGTMYLDWEKYHSWFTSYETDAEYIKYFEEISKKIKWIKGYMECERESPEWIEMEARGFRQAVKIAVDFPRISFDLAFTAYTDHIWNVRFDYVYREDIDRLLFEIWKRATAQKITFRDALHQVNQANMFHRRKERMQFALDNNIYSSLQSAFDTCVEGIADDAPDDEARILITSGGLEQASQAKDMEPVYYEEDRDC